MYSGDIDQDGFIDGYDLLQIDNAANIFTSGYVVTDITGDNFVDGTDYSIADNNAALFVSVIEPPGAAPLFEPNVQELEKQLAAETDNAVRQKIQTAINLAKENSVESNSKKMSYEDFHKMNNPDWKQSKPASKEISKEIPSKVTEQPDAIDNRAGIK
jgi:hypothetical protein